jgi:hypothetical protein
LEPFSQKSTLVLYLFCENIFLIVKV